MFDYIQQFKRLPKELREKVSSPAAMDVLSELERKYNINLAATIMKVMVKKIPIRDLPSYFVSEFSFNPQDARNLSSELKERIFFIVSGYLGLKPALANEDKDALDIIKKSNLSFPNEDLELRCRRAVTTYLRGVRSKIDTRSLLERPIKAGGLGLNQEQSDRLLKTTTSLIAGLESFGRESLSSISDQKTESKKTEPALPSAPKKEESALKIEKLDKIISKQDSAKETVDSYDLKKEIQTGRTPSIASPDEKKQLSAKADLKFLPKVSKRDLEKKIEAGPEIKQLLPEKEVEPKLSSIRKDEEVSEKKKTVLPTAPKKEVQEDQREELKKDDQDKVSQIESRKFESFAPPPKSSMLGGLFKKKKTIDSAPSLSEKESKSPPSVKGQPVKERFSKDLEKKEEDKKAQASHQSRPSSLISPSIPEDIIKSSSSPFKPRPAAGSRAKPKLEDIRSVPKVMSPTDELRYLDVLNFRRLGSSPEEVIEKIKNKIELIGQDGYDRRLAAISAWRKSPVSRLYVIIGQEAINKGITIKEAAIARKEKGREFLDWEEIKAVVNLNASLMS